MGSHVSKTIRKGITSASNFEDEPERNNLKMGVLTREFANHISVRQ